MNTSVIYIIFTAKTQGCHVRNKNKLQDYTPTAITSGCSRHTIQERTDHCNQESILRGHLTLVQWLDSNPKLHSRGHYFETWSSNWLSWLKDSSSLLISEDTSHPMLHYAPCTKAHWEVEVQLHAFLNLSIICGQVIGFTSWLVHTCQNSMQYLLNRKLGGPHRKSGCNELNPNFIGVQPIPRWYIK